MYIMLSVGLDNRLSSLDAVGSMAWGVLLVVHIVGSLEALDIVKASLEGRANKVGEAVHVP